MKRLLLLSIVLLLCAAGASAQEKEVDVVRLKSGITVRGTILGELSDGSIKMSSISGDIFIYRPDEIDDIKREKIGSAAPTPNLSVSSENDLQPFSLQKYNLMHKPKKGYMGIVEAGVGYSWIKYRGRSFYDYWEGSTEIPVSLTIINGYKFSPYFYIGLGVGVNYYPRRIDALTIPVFAHIRATFTKKRIAPYLAVSAGYHFDLSHYINYSDFESGHYVEPTVGVQFNTQGNHFWEVGVGAHFISPGGGPMLRVGYAF